MKNKDNQENPEREQLSRRNFFRNAGLVSAGLTLSSAAELAGNSPLPQQPDNLVSPEVLPDRRVIFRLFAPNARSVTIGGNWPIGDGRGGNDKAMTKGADGIWTITLESMPVEFYGYYYTVDGRRTLDLNDIFVDRDGFNYLNELRVPGPELGDFEVNDVPHGTLSRIWYPSPMFGVNRRAYLYTPPGYETGNQEYPVLYLLHGGGGDEDAWTTLGHAPQILDNLIARGKAKPMIVVMPNGNSARVGGPELRLSDSHPESNVSGQDRDRTRFPASLVADLIPYIDGTYRTRSDREFRAIAGLSVGGAQTMFAAFNHPEMFTYVAAFSGGFPAFPDWAVDIEPPPNADKLRGPDINKSIDPEKYLARHPYLNEEINARFRLLYISMGMMDGLISNHRDMKAMLDSQGVKYTLFENDYYGHDWGFWRLTLHDLLPRLF